MNCVRNSLRRIVSVIFGLFGVRYANGVLALVVTGTKSLQIDLDFTPREVWLMLKEPVCVPVCQAVTDAFDCHIIPNGFVLTVTLGSEYREVEWIAVK